MLVTLDALRCKQIITPIASSSRIDLLVAPEALWEVTPGIQSASQVHISRVSRPELS